MENLLQKFIFLLLSHIFPWMNKFFITENIFLPRLLKQESCRSSHCISQSPQKECRPGIDYAIN